MIFASHFPGLRRKAASSIILEARSAHVDMCHERLSDSAKRGAAVEVFAERERSNVVATCSIPSVRPICPTFNRKECSLTN